MNRKDAEINLRTTFCLNIFYKTQWQAIHRILNGKRILMIQKTGFGKLF